MTTSITTAVVMVVAAIGPHDAWREPILRPVDTAFGALIGVGQRGSVRSVLTLNQVPSLVVRSRPVERGH